MTVSRPSVGQKRAEFRRLHERGCFAIPNPWDVGTACYLQHLGFKALATTSAGFAFSLGRPDYGITRGIALEHIAQLVQATDVPVNADFENGFAHEPDGVAESVRLCVATGVAGLSIEDATGDREKPLYDLDYAVARIRAARAAIDRTGGDVLLTARAECFLVGRPDLEETTTRLKAYAGAGADVLYAPGIRTREQIVAVVKAVMPKPVNVLIAAPIGFTIENLGDLGVRRVSVGGGLSRVAWGAVMSAARMLAEEGRFDGFAGAAPSAELNTLFAEDIKRRQ
jgi:2-methylisocitrate lyase-like PEP mutase family enzyme